MLLCSCPYSLTLSAHFLVRFSVVLQQYQHCTVLVPVFNKYPSWQRREDVASRRHDGRRHDGWDDGCDGSRPKRGETTRTAAEDQADGRGEEIGRHDDADLLRHRFVHLAAPLRRSHLPLHESAEEQ